MTVFSLGLLLSNLVVFALSVGVRLWQIPFRSEIVMDSFTDIQIIAHTCPPIVEGVLCSGMLKKARIGLHVYLQRTLQRAPMRLAKIREIPRFK